jgi:hypothetical protein
LRFFFAIVFAALFLKSAKGSSRSAERNQKLVATSGLGVPVLRVFLKS